MFGKRFKLKTFYNRKLIGNHMRPIEWHQNQWPWVTLKVTLVAWNLSNSHTLRNIARFNYDVFTHELESARGLNFSCRIETEGLLVVTSSHARCNSGNILEMVPDRDVVTTERRCESDIRPIISSDLEWPSRSFIYYTAFQMLFFQQLFSCWQDFNWHRVAIGVSAITELLVIL